MQAYVRGTWEASQYVMRKADINEFTTWRAIFLSKAEIENDGKAIKKTVEYEWSPSRYERKEKKEEEFTALPGIRLKRNGAASTSSLPSVCNSWGGVGNKPENSQRVVLRIRSPRTACVSAPCFGQNLHNEEEIVLAGTTWRGWDAWLDKAPPVGFDQQPETSYVKPTQESVEPDQGGLASRARSPTASAERGSSSTASR